MVEYVSAVFKSFQQKAVINLFPPRSCNTLISDHCPGSKTLQKLSHMPVFMLQLRLMTSWAVVCDVFFLPPQQLRPGETSQHFAERVQHMIAARAKLTVAPWDGYLKYYNLGAKVSDTFWTVSRHNVWLEG